MRQASSAKAVFPPDQSLPSRCKDLSLTRLAAYPTRERPRLFHKAESGCGAPDRLIEVGCWHEADLPAAPPIEEVTSASRTRPAIDSRDGPPGGVYTLELQITCRRFSSASTTASAISEKVRSSLDIDKWVRCRLTPGSNPSFLCPIFSAAMSASDTKLTYRPSQLTSGNWVEQTSSGHTAKGR